MPLRNLLTLLVILILSALSFFGHLDSVPMQRWDEARVATQAYEMYESGDLIVPTVNHQPDLENTKPPLMLWAQVLSFKVLGPGTLSARVPAAVFALFTVLLIFWFYAVKQRQLIRGTVACIVLLCTGRYLALHGVRTADFDSMLTFFTTGYILFFYIYLSEKKKKYLLLTTIFITLAYLTKDIQALIFLPALFMMAIYFKQGVAIIRSKEFYLGLLIFLILVPGYYILRESRNPGFMDAVMHNQWGRRAFETVEEHYGGPLYYLDILWGKINMIFAIAPLAILLCFDGNKSISKRVIYLAGTVLFYVVIISMIQTKIEWYLLPAYPIVAMLTAELIGKILDITTFSNLNNMALKTGAVFAFVAIGFAYPYWTTLKFAFDPVEYRDDAFFMAKYLHDVEKGKVDVNGLTFLYSDYDQEILWYYRILHEKHDIKYRDVIYLEPGDRPIAYREKTKNAIEQAFDYTVIKDYYGVKTYTINGVKDSISTVQ